MTLLIGIDEAGYGPNLGPLCIGATAWFVDEKALAPSAVLLQPTNGPSVDLYQLLADVVSPTPDETRIAIADSKRLYKPASHSKSSGLRHLERGVLTALAVLDRTPEDWQALLDPPELPWYGDFNSALPMDANSEEIAMLAERFSTACKTASLRLVDVRARLVFPPEFNELTAYYGTKGAALSHVSIELLREVWLASSAKTNTGELDVAKKSIATRSSLPTARTTQTRIYCDKHGGRNRYGALLQHHFPDEWIETVKESRPASRYRWGPPESRTEICFRTQGEAELPVALASMAAKYHRELAMRAFNAFWGDHVPGIKPTAGYPQDAKRFKAEIEAVQSRLRIDDRLLWRNR